MHRVSPLLEDRGPQSSSHHIPASVQKVVCVLYTHTHIIVIHTRQDGFLVRLGTCCVKAIGYLADINSVLYMRYKSIMSYDVVMVNPL